MDGVENGLGSNAKRKFASKKPSKGKELTPSDSNLESEFKMKSKFQKEDQSKSPNKKK